MKIRDVLVVPGMTGYYFDDLEAIRAGAEMDGFQYVGQPLTPGHSKIRQKGECISVIIILENGETAFGDCCAIQYSNVVGRDPVFVAANYVNVIEEAVVPHLRDSQIKSFKDMSKTLESLEYRGNKLHTAIRYGVSQAILDATAKIQKCTIAEVIAKEYNTIIKAEMIPVLAQSGDDRYQNADKMILKSIPVIPQGLFNRIDKIGCRGERLLEYAGWLRNRVLRYGAPDYHPRFHFDVYGTIGKVFDDDINRLVDYLAILAAICQPFEVTVECPIDIANKHDLIHRMNELKTTLSRRGINVLICADDWCNTFEDIKEFVDCQAAHMIQVKAPDLGSLHNTVEAALYCKDNNVKAFVGGTCNSTDQSSRITVNIALAVNADQIYNIPGMGVDEGYMIVFNEMQRVLAMLGKRGTND
jgi:methylaspartate ammonia-lyase